jgi:hypothetical protein
LELIAVVPLTFEVLYQWPYTGSVRDIVELAVESNVEIALLWLRIFNMLHEYMISPMQEISFYRFQNSFHDFYRVVPSAACVQELYESSLPSNLGAC